ncbi:fimbrial protein [Enterobacter asburiae]|jgi:type 1 fimbria pilin|uniref:fimbrial protein n=1 Tax=Enterobacter asburiae TaxID=61645 RepID=UPI001F1F5EC8|nr:fimbrial protein [Enterobacter asburiae]
MSTHRILTLLAAVNVIFAALTLPVGKALGATECRFGNGYGGTTTLINSHYTGGAIRIPSPGDGSNVIASFDNDISPGIQGNCSLGNDGMDLWSKTDPSVMDGSLYGNAIFETNIPGIVYEVRIHTVANAGNDSGGYFGANTGGYEIVSHNSSATGNWDNFWFNAKVNIRVTDGFVGNPQKVSVLKPKAGTLGSMSIGNPTDSNNKPWTFVITENSFQIPIILPTCEVMALNGGGNNVDLGEYFIADIKKNITRDIPFAITVNGCTSVAKFTMKMSSTALTGGTQNLLANMLNSNAASGVGVKVLYGSMIQLVPNNANSAIVLNDTSVPNAVTQNLIARLEADGNTIKAGNFKATSVFTMTYD